MFVKFHDNWLGIDQEVGDFFFTTAGSKCESDYHDYG